MAGQIKKALDTLISQKANGNPMLEKIIVTKLALKGINVKDFSTTSADDPAIMQKISALAAEIK